MSKTKRQALLSDEEIITRVEAKVNSSSGWPGTPLSKENEKVISYYNSELPSQQNKGRSSYRSSDVYDSVETMKAQLLETFSAGREIIKFKANSPQDTEQARIETKFVDHVVFAENDGILTFHDVIHDGLTARKGVAEVYWLEDYVYDTQTFDDLSTEDVYALASDPEISDLEADLDADDDAIVEPTSAIYSGKYRRRIDKSRICIEAVPPEEYFVERGVKRREDGIRGRRKLVTRSDLLKMGYKKSVVNKIKWDGDKSINLAPEKIAREKPVSGMDNLGNDQIQDELRGVVLIEAYTEMVMYDDAEASLWRVVYAGEVLLEKDEVDADPYIEFDPLRIPHTAWGANYAARVIQTQNARTVLTRGILDHTSITLNPRWTVLTGGLVNPKEMLDNRQGGLVNVTRPDAVTPLLYGNLNPFVYQTLEMLKHNKEEATGISALSQGLNKDAISKQNSDAMIDNLITVSQIRQKVIARFFATQFLVPLYLKVWKLAAEHESKDKIIEIAGNFIQVNPKTWGTQRQCWLSPHLGYGEAEKEGQKYGAAYQNLSRDPLWARFPDKYKYKLLGDAFQKNGFDNWQDYIPPPEEWTPPPGPDPVEMTKAEATKTQADASMLSAQSSAHKAQIAEHREMLRTQNDTAKTTATVDKMYADTERQNLETVNRVDVEQRNIALEEQMRPKEMQRGKEAAQEAR